jgi:hypothetical protein
VLITQLLRPEKNVAQGLSFRLLDVYDYQTCSASQRKNYEKITKIPKLGNA